MRIKVLAALGVVAALAAGILFAQRAARRTESEGREATRVAAFDDRAVTAIAITSRGGKGRVVREAGAWRFVEPVRDAASSSAVEEILVALRRTPILQSMPESAPSLEFGLDPPATQIALEGVEAPVVEIGDLVPTGEGVYARIAGRPGVVVLRLPDAAPLATVTLAHLRDPALIGATPSAITALEIAPGGIRLKREGPAWWIDAPARLPAATARVDALVASLTGAKVAMWDERASIADPRFGLGPQATRLVVHEGERALRITLGADAGEGSRYAVRDEHPPVMTVVLPGFEAAALDVEALREPKLTSVNRYRVTRVVYVRDGRRFAAARGGDGSWSREGGGPVAKESVLELLVALLEAETPSWTAGSLPPGPAATVEYATDEGAEGKLAISGQRATWSAAPGVVFRIRGPLPQAP